MTTPWLDAIEARLAGLGLPWEAKDDQGTPHRGTVRDSGGEAVAITYCTSMDTVHGREMARVIAAMPADLRRLLRVARAAERYRVEGHCFEHAHTLSWCTTCREAAAATAELDAALAEEAR